MPPHAPKASASADLLDEQGFVRVTETLQVPGHPEVFAIGDVASFDPGTAKPLPGLAPVAKALNDAVGIENGLMTTVHAYTNDQNLSDVYHSDPYRARSATHSMIPTRTGAAQAVGLVLPELAGKFDGLAVRVPVINVSLVDLTFTAGRDTTREEINAIVEKAAAGSAVLDVNAQPLVSIDFNHNAHSSIFDANHTRVNGRLVKIMAWYDNEWGFSNRMLDTAIAMQKTA